MHLLQAFATVLPLFALQASAAQKDQSPVLIHSAMSGTDWSSKHAEWHNRARAHPNPASFEPSRSELVLAVLRNTKVDPEGFTLALFKSSSSERTDVGGIAVDAMGRVLEVKKDDFTCMESLAQSVIALPPTDSFRNTWVLKRERTEQPIERILVPVAGSSDLKQTCVQGFSKGVTKLKYPVGEGITELPPVLVELAGLMMEARDGYSRGEEDSSMISRVKALLGDVL